MNNDQPPLPEPKCSQGVAHYHPSYTSDQMRGYGNAIVPQVAAEFIGAFLDVTETS